MSHTTTLNVTQKSRHGFTLVEMLVAMAVTLLLMAAIARGFAFVGERIGDSRANLYLSGELTDITTRLRDELNRCTVNLTPNKGEPDQAGYFLYYEGQVTDATSSLFRTAGTVASPELPDSRYGDFDDYLAFTAIAPPNSWFTGKVPRYVLEQRRSDVEGTAYSLPTGPYNTANPDPFEPVVIQSRYAEIVYFASPEYVASSLPASPAYVDSDGDTDLGGGTPGVENGIPDRLRLHRRVLLIRPDLNLNAGNLPIQSKSITTSSGTTTVQFMHADVWPTAASTSISTGATAADAWMYGMAGVHQQCDLSVRRVLDPSTGLPLATGAVAANSLADLSKPHNRFAHVRIPGGALSGAGALTQTSMPVLALGPPATILGMRSATPNDLAPPLTPNAGPVVTPHRLCGFLRPEFVLGNDLSHLDIPNDSWGLERIGEDLVVNNVIGFDIKIYDPLATSFTTASSGLVVGPNDAGYREALLEAVSNVTTSAARGWHVGSFVDLAYPVLAGGSLRGWQPREIDRLSTAPSSAIPTTGNFLITPFSGIANYDPVPPSTGANSRTAYSNSLYRSGRILTDGTSIQLFQPAFDTYTSHYEQDGFLQDRVEPSEGTRWITLPSPLNAATKAAIDLGSDGVDSAGIYRSGFPSVSGVFGADDIGEHETQPPFLAAAESIQISIRLENPKTRQLRQMSVVHRDIR